MKLILFFVISCLALHNGNGAPRTAVYKFVRCNPERDQANCVPQQTPEMAWTPDLPSKLPASAAQYLEAEAVEGESPLGEEEELDEKKTIEDPPMLGEEGESPFYPFEEGSGYEGSASEDMYMADLAATSETGSGESWTGKELLRGRDSRGMRRLFPSRPLVGEAKPAEQELKEDHLLV